MKNDFLCESENILEECSQIKLAIIYDCSFNVVNDIKTLYLKILQFQKFHNF